MILIALAGLFYGLALQEAFRHIIKMYNKEYVFWMVWAWQAVNWPHVLLFFIIGSFLILAGILLVDNR